MPGGGRGGVSVRTQGGDAAVGSPDGVQVSPEATALALRALPAHNPAAQLRAKTQTAVETDPGWLRGAPPPYDVGRRLGQRPFTSEGVAMSTESETPNILLIIADDLGQDVVSMTGSDATRAIEVHTIDSAGVDIVGALPNVSYLLRNGLYFGQAWAQPAPSSASPPAPICRRAMWSISTGRSTRRRWLNQASRSTGTTRIPGRAAR